MMLFDFLSNCTCVSRLKYLVVAATFLISVFACLPVAAQEYGGNLTPPPPRPRRAYSTIDTYNYTHGGGDTTYSDSYKKARRVKKIRKVKQAILKTKVDDTTSKVTTGSSGTGHSLNGLDSDSSSKSDSGASSGTPKSGKSESEANAKSDRTNVPDTASDTDTTDTSSTSKSTGSEASNKSVSSETSNNSDGDNDGSKTQNSVAQRGTKLSSVPPPQMPPPPTSIGGFEMKGSSAK